MTMALITSNTPTPPTEQKQKQHSGLFNTLPNELVLIIFQFLLEGDKEGPVLFNRVLRINAEFYGMCDWKITHCFSSLFNKIRFNWTHLERAAQKPEAEQGLIEKLLKNKNCSDQLNFDFLKTTITNTTQQNEQAITTILKTETCQEIIKNEFSKSFCTGEKFLITLIMKKNQTMVQVLWELINQCHHQILNPTYLFKKSLENDCYKLSDWIFETNRSSFPYNQDRFDNSFLLNSFARPGNHSLIRKFPLTNRPEGTYSLLSLAIEKKKPEIVKELLKNRTVLIDCLASDVKQSAFFLLIYTISLLVIGTVGLVIDLALSKSVMPVLLVAKVMFLSIFAFSGALVLLAATAQATYHLFQLAKAVFFLASHYFFERIHPPFQKHIQPIKT